MGAGAFDGTLGAAGLGGDHATEDADVASVLLELAKELATGFLFLDDSILQLPVPLKPVPLKPVPLKGESEKERMQDKIL